MQCSYYYTDGNKELLLKHDECGSSSDLKLYEKSMQDAAAVFDTTANCNYY